MSDSLPTVWSADPHTLVKHAILRRYLQAWMPILTQQAKRLKQQFGNLNSREILFIDGFAGPGEYKDGEIGSPLIAVKVALEHHIEFPMPVRMLFIELDRARFDHLQSVLTPHLEQVNKSNNIAVNSMQGDCDEVLNRMLDEYEKRQIKFGPALAFLDQFGYGAVSMKLIRRILAYPQCEVFTYLNYKDMNRWISDEAKAPALIRAFGGEEWRECISLPEKERREKLLELYKVALRQQDRGNAKYVVSFLMFDRMGVPLYWLIFCTKNLRGLEEMKKAMWSVDKSGEFRFSDKDDPNQLKLLTEAFDQKWLASELKSRLAGQELSAEDVKKFVLVETPCYLFRGALRSLETDNTVKVLSHHTNRNPGTYPDASLGQIRLRFSESLF